MNTVFLFVTLLTMLAVGLPVAMALGLSSILTILLFEHDSLASLTLKFFQTFEQFTLLAIPFSLPPVPCPSLARVCAEHATLVRAFRPVKAPPAAQPPPQAEGRAAGRQCRGGR